MLMVGYLLSIGYLLSREMGNVHLELEVTELGYLDVSVTVFEGCSLRVKLVFLHVCYLYTISLWLAVNKSLTAHLCCLSSVSLLQRVSLQ